MKSPDMSTLALGYCTPSGSYVHNKQIPPAHFTYVYNIKLTL